MEFLVLFLFPFSLETNLKRKATEKAKQRAFTIRQKRRLSVGKLMFFFSRSRTLRHASNFMHDCVHDSSLANHPQSQTLLYLKYINVIYASDSAHMKDRLIELKSIFCRSIRQARSSRTVGRPELIRTSDLACVEPNYKVRKI